jgi:ABC-type transport system substrate-binding protein
LLDFLQILQGYWNEVGIQVEIEIVDSNEWNTYLFNPNRLTGTEPNVGWIFPWISESTPNSIYQAENLYCSWGLHNCGNDSVADFLFNRASQELNPTLALQYWRSFQTYARGMYVNIGICQIKPLKVVGPNLGEFTANTHLSLYDALAGIQHPE